MSTFATRRWIAATATLVAALIAVVVMTAHRLVLHDTAFGSGWVLLSMLIFLAVYNLRKKLTYPPLGRASAWLQGHLYVGLFTVVLFGLHVGMRLPNGVLESTMAVLFVAVAGSGMVGILLSRVIPARLADRGQEVLFERIPVFRRQLQEQAERLIIDCVEDGDATTLADFYRDRLARFFHGPRHFWHHLAQSSRPRVRLEQALRGLDRYMSPKERAAAGTLLELIGTKDDLDFHNALQATLKYWLYVHVPLTYALLLLVGLHVTLVLGFRAGIG